jgi:hypothetical protein
MSFIHQIKVPIRWPNQPEDGARVVLSWRLDACTGRPVMAWRSAPASSARLPTREEEARHGRRI